MLIKTTSQLTTAKDQVRQVRDMLNAERASKEKINSSLTGQLEVAKKTIGTLFVGPQTSQNSDCCNEVLFSAVHYWSAART
jgi:Fic family protein